MSSLVFFSLACLVWLVGAWVMTFLHEIGHALTVVLLSKQKVNVYMGMQPITDEQIAQVRASTPTLIFSIGNLTFSLLLLSLPGIGFFSYAQRMSRRSTFAAYLAGPVTTLFLLIILSLSTYLLKPTTTSSILQWWSYYSCQGLALEALFQLLATCLPIAYPRWWGAYAGFHSDGYRMRQLLLHSSESKDKEGETRRAHEHAS